MKPIRATGLLALAALLLAPFPAPAATATVLPDGTYRYELRVAGTVLGTSSVKLARSDAGLAVEETALYGSGTVAALTMADPSSLATSHYEASYPSSDGAKIRRTVSIHDTTATVIGDGLSNKTIALLEGSKTFVVPDQALASGFFLLPAQMRDAAALVTGIGPLSGTRFQVRRESAGTDRPRDAAANDVGLTVKMAAVDVTLWYDRTTFVLDEVDAPQQQMVLRRI